MAPPRLTRRAREALPTAQRVRHASGSGAMSACLVTARFHPPGSLSAPMASDAGSVMAAVRLGRW